MCSCDFENYCGAAHQHDNRNLLFYSFWIENLNNCSITKNFY
jgi:hypothetical protein